VPITNLCDRFSTNRAGSQIGFIDFVVLPIFVQLNRSYPLFQTCVDQLNENKAYWKEQIPNYEEELTALKERREEWD
jgi:hypothetical protein